MFHRHLTLERYEVALEEDPDAAARMKAAARRCPVCERALSQGSLSATLVACTPSPHVETPVDWRAALRRAIAPSSQPVAASLSRLWRVGAVVAVLSTVMLAAALPVAASAGPDSVLYPVRGVEEDSRWWLTPESEQPKLEARLASAYLWEARVSAGRRDRDGYQASMDRFFQWADRLRSDVRKAPAAERVQVREIVIAARSLVPALAASAGDPSQAKRADSVLENVQGQSQEGNGEHQSSQPATGVHLSGDREPPQRLQRGQQPAARQESGRDRQSANGDQPGLPQGGDAAVHRDG